MLPTDVEEERCRAVEQLYLLDTPPEERFAQITRMARSAFEVPMAGRRYRCSIGTDSGSNKLTGSRSAAVCHGLKQYAQQPFFAPMSNPATRV